MICMLHRFFLHYSTVLSYLHILYIGMHLELIQFSTCTNPIIHPFYPQKNLHRQCFTFLLGLLHVAGEIANDYANFWWVKEVYCGICQVRNAYNLEADEVYENRRHLIISFISKKEGALPENAYTKLR